MSSEQGVGGSSPSAGTNFMPVIFIILGILIIILSFTAFFGAPYVPSLKSELKKAFTKLYPLSEKDTLIDLGAGDGVVLKVASEFKAKGIGIELNPVFALISKFRLRKIKNTKILTKNFYNYEFPEETTAVYIFGDSRDIEKITRKIEREAKRLKKSIYVISNGFRLPSHKPIKHVGAYYLYRIK